MDKKDKFILKRKVMNEAPITLIDFLAKYTPFSKSLLKKIVDTGAVWLKENNSKKLLRIRRVTSQLKKDDYIELYYDQKILETLPTQIPEPILETRDWGIWFKPQGLLTQGTKYGDHCSLLRYVEKSRPLVYLIHRIDREASGLVIFAYGKRAASSLSTLWQNGPVIKTYHVQVLGEIPDKTRVINLPLDGKESETQYELLSTNQSISTLKVIIKTGRFHQIRRHMNMIGYPVIGDPEYGQSNKNQNGLRLFAIELEFKDPISRKNIICKLPKELHPF